MTRELTALLLERGQLSLDELAAGCAVSREWVIEHVEAGVLVCEGGGERKPEERWSFSGLDLSRARQLRSVERDFDANPELAGLVADLLEEVQRLRTRLRRAGLPLE